MMGTSDDFVIVNGVLEQYDGPGGDVVIPEGVTRIRPYAFDDRSGTYSGENDSIRSVTVPEGVEILDRGIFAQCKKLKKVILPKSLKKIDWNAFDYWNEVQGVYINDLASWCSIEIDDEGNVFDHFESKGKLYLKGVLVEDLVIPDGVTQIGRNAFAGYESLKSVVIPDSVRIIKRGAFENCRNLRKVLLSNNLTEIGDEAFRSCESLSGITLPESLQRIGAAAFYDSHITGIKILQNVTRIGESAFAGCSSLKYAELPDHLERIPECLFSDCSMLKKIRIPYGVKTIGGGAFCGCSSLEEVQLPCTLTEIEDDRHRNWRQWTWGGAFSESGIRTIRLPDGLRSLGSCAFSRCTQLEKVELPETLREIHAHAFEGCTALKEITLPKSITGIP